MFSIYIQCGEFKTWVIRLLYTSKVQPNRTGEVWKWGTLPGSVFSPLSSCAPKTCRPVLILGSKLLLNVNVWVQGALVMIGLDSSPPVTLRAKVSNMLGVLDPHGGCVCASSVISAKTPRGWSVVSLWGFCPRDLKEHLPHWCALVPVRCSEMWDEIWLLVSRKLDSGPAVVEDWYLQLHPQRRVGPDR